MLQNFFLIISGFSSYIIGLPYFFYYFLFSISCLQDEPSVQSLQENNGQLSRQTVEIATSVQTKTELVEVNSKPSGSICEACDEVSNESNEFLERCNANSFLRRFSFEIVP